MSCGRCFSAARREKQREKLPEIHRGAAPPLADVALSGLCNKYKCPAATAFLQSAARNNARNCREFTVGLHPPLVDVALSGLCNKYK